MFPTNCWFDFSLKRAQKLRAIVKKPYFRIIMLKFNELYCIPTKLVFHSRPSLGKGSLSLTS